MNAEKTIFNRNKEYENGDTFRFKFEGIISNQDVENEKVNRLIDSFVNEQTYHKDMLRNVSFIRTMLKDFKEELLVVEYTNRDGESEIVKYDDGRLLYFGCNNKNKKTGNTMSVEFSPYEDLNISFLDSALDVSIVDYPQSEYVDEQFCELIKHIRLLKNAEAIKLDRDSKALIEIYKLFYGENPNFSLSNINVRVQTMLSILEQFGVSLGDHYVFNLLGKAKMPISLNLEQLVSKLFPLGEITAIDDPFKLADETRNIIKAAGECVREVINDEYNSDDILITISKVIHAKTHILSSESDIKELSEFTNRTRSEIESSIKLVKRIENKISELDK